MVKTVKVVVLGDIGRSPRMQYHALSLANNGLKVNIIGYQDSEPLEDILQNENITITKLKPVVYNKGPRLFQYFVKAFWQACSLYLTLLKTGKNDFLLCQTPPAIPTLVVCRTYCITTRTKFVIDWHNYAFSIMALSLAPTTINNIFLNVVMRIEFCFAMLAYYHFCVTNAMKESLLRKRIRAKVLYDRPPQIFHPITLEEKHAWFVKISQKYPEFGSEGGEEVNQPAGEGVTKTAFTQLVGGVVEERPDRPGILFSSTSWTPDEDFGVLMQALQVYETTYTLTNRLPKLICVITGKGPMKQHYVEQIAAKKWNNVKVVTPWLEAADYPTMVAASDLGVSLHTSSSGLDLPMKVVDMFGAGLPVCAFDFKCIGELVENGVNGYTFKNSDELAKQIVTWFEDFPNNTEQNIIAESMRNKLTEFQKLRWEENWNLRAREIFVS